MEIQSSNPCPRLLEWIFNWRPVYLNYGFLYGLLHHVQLIETLGVGSIQFGYILFVELVRFTINIWQKCRTLGIGFLLFFVRLVLCALPIIGIGIDFAVDFGFFTNGWNLPGDNCVHIFIGY